MQRVTFLPSGVVETALRDELLIDVARRAGVFVAAPCGGRRRCGGCAVRVVEGTLDTPSPDEAAMLGFASADVRMACRARVRGDVVVRTFGDMTTATDARAGAGAAPGGRIALGVDLGTTSVAAAVVDIEDCRVLATGSSPNLQAHHGADVLARIQAADADPGTLQQQAARSIEQAALRALSSAGVAASSIERAVVAGNSAMAALLTGVSAASLLSPPFDAPEVPARVTLTLLDHAVEAQVLAPLYAFVGGDSRAVLSAVAPVAPRGPWMVVDLGTNAEILLVSDDVVYVASAAAGPAFEGGGVGCAGPAVEGAVVSARVEGSRIVTDPEDASDAPWLVGSAVIGLLASLRSAEALDHTGLMRPTEALEGRWSVDEDSGVVGVRVTDGLVLTQLDVRAIQMAKAAVVAGIETVLDAAGVVPAEVERVYVAGALGSAIDSDDLVALGVLPQAFAGRIESTGNASLAGASKIACEGTESPLPRAVGVDLAGDTGFERRFLGSFGLSPQ